MDLIPPLSGLRGTPSPKLRTWESLLLVASLLLIGSIDSPQGGDPATPLTVLENAFRRGNAQTLRPLMDPDQKIFARSSALGFEGGYYSADQVYLVVQGAFRVQTTSRFDFLRREAPSPPANRLVAVARWIYRPGRSRERTTDISFTLVRRGGVWILQEIRDVS